MKRSSSAQAVTPTDVSMDFPEALASVRALRTPSAVTCQKFPTSPQKFCGLTRSECKFCDVRPQQEEVSCSASTQRQRAAVCPRRSVTHKQMTVLYTTDRHPAGRAAESGLERLGTKMRGRERRTETENREDIETKK